MVFTVPVQQPPTALVRMIASSSEVNVVPTAPSATARAAVASVGAMLTAFVVVAGSR